ncbi:phosphoribosylformylglycinamidine cyclo-ligase [bacterium]|nr:phosphoribosylformylglycinamidine cyclo-ligase [bacterium]
MEHDAYREAGVDIDAAMATKRTIRDMVRSTFRPEVLTDIGSFGGLFKPDFSGIVKPVLVSSADGVGTKLKVACMTGRHDTVGADLVNHCCNDILVMGARPLFFLDYLAYSRHDDTMVCSVISGMTRACRENRCALVGGEMAELPDVYHPGEYDLAGVIVGVVSEQRILDGSRVSDGDRILGLASTGLHTNGYSLARRLLFQTAGLAPGDMLPGTETTVADALLAVHRSYGPSILPFLDDTTIHAMAHITGGGFTGNIDRTLPGHLDALIDLDSWPVPPLFRFMAKTGGLSEKELYRTFNMGIGLTVTVGAKDAAAAANLLRSSGEEVYEIGRVVPGSREVRLVHGDA